MILLGKSHPHLRLKREKASVCQCIDYLGHAVTLSHQVIYQLIGQRTILGLTHLKYKHILRKHLVI